MKTWKFAGGCVAKSVAPLVVLSAGLLSGCGGSPSSGTRNAQPTTKTGTTSTMLMQVRTAGQVGNELDVQPLRDPQVEDLRATATQAENRGDFAAAKRALAQALLVTPEDPDLLQWQAELALATREWAQAEQLAMRSYERGPKLGGLCRRNWTTIRLAAESRGNGAAAAQASQRVAACKVAPPTRM